MKEANNEILALKVNQWLKEWELVSFDKQNHRERPEPFFFVFSISASDLKALSGIYRRSTKSGVKRSQDLGIQRFHDKERSDKIHDFIQYGYPWSELSQGKRASGQFDDLRKPGWLPTAIVVNILKKGDKRNGKTVSPEDLIKVQNIDSNIVKLELPSSFTGSSWNFKTIPPIEVIDGQHRLWAFEEASLTGDYELPVVAFTGLDLSWQAYLFWSINVTPKRINASLAFDLYPLLRKEDWLERFEGHSIYRESRAQELTEALWSHPESPWYQKINMLGETGLQEKMVSQAAWIRSLMATYVKSWDGKGSIGGLFGAPVGSDEEVLVWSRAQQAAFLILMGQKVRDAVRSCKEKWAEILRSLQVPALLKQPDPAFFGPYSLFSTDQGIRGMLFITNDLCYLRAEELQLKDWSTEENAGASDEEAVSKALKSLKKTRLSEFLDTIAKLLKNYDWRTSSTPGLSDDERLRKAALRGSGGYKELRKQLLDHIGNSKTDAGDAAQKALTALGYQ